MAYTDVFGGSTIYPSEVSYLALTLTGDVELEWPLENSGANYPAARIIGVTTAADYDIALPDATLTGPGQTILFDNLSASSSAFTVKDNAGGIVATVGVGEAWQVYLSDNATAAGVWQVYQAGASTATVQASALAGYGLTVTSNQLSQSMPVTTFNSSPRTLLVTDRASLMTWIGTGAGTIDLPSAVSAGGNFFFSVRNAGGGILTIDPSGSETIDGDTTLALQPGSSATIATDGLVWYTVGLGQQAVFAFDYTSIDLTAESSPYVLSGSELNRTAYEFIGTLSGNIDIVVPPTYQQYWVSNVTIGAYTLTVKTASGSGVSVNQGARNILYCNGTDIVDADTANLAVPISASQGGTGQISYTIGDMLYASGTTTLSKIADVATGNVLLSGGVGVAPAWGKVSLTAAVSGTLPVDHGGTGVTTSTGTGNAVLSDAPTLLNPVVGTQTLGDNTTKAASTAFVTAAISASGAGGWTQISSQSASGTAVNFTSIPQTYQDLLLVSVGVSHNNGSATFMSVSLSNTNGASYSANSIIFGTSTVNSVTWYGSLLLPGYRKDAGMIEGCAVNLTADQTMGTPVAANQAGWRMNGGVNALSVFPVSGSFDAGTLILYGK